MATFPPEILFTAGITTTLSSLHVGATVPLIR